MNYCIVRRCQNVAKAQISNGAVDFTLCDEHIDKAEEIKRDFNEKLWRLEKKRLTLLHKMADAIRNIGAKDAHQQIDEIPPDTGGD